MSTSSTKATPVFTSPEAEDWFGQLVHQIKVDQIQLQTGVANKDKSEFYKHAIAGNTDEILKRLRIDASQAFVDKIIRGFLVELSNRKATPQKLAFALTPATIMAWAEINDNDENTEDAILLAEAKINSFAKEFDFCVDTMVVEKSDGLQIPSHYFPIIS